MVSGLIDLTQPMIRELLCPGCPLLFMEEEWCLGPGTAGFGPWTRPCNDYGGPGWGHRLSFHYACHVPSAANDKFR